MFNTITGINASKTIKYISCKCKCKFDGRKCNSNQKWDNGKCWCECKNHICGKNYIWNPDTGSCKNGKYLAYIFGNDILIICEEILDVRVKSFDEETKTVSTKVNEKEVASKIKKLYILLGF